MLWERALSPIIIVIWSKYKKMMVDAAKLMFARVVTHATPRVTHLHRLMVGVRRTISSGLQRATSLRFGMERRAARVPAAVVVLAAEAHVVASAARAAEVDALANVAHAAPRASLSRVAVSHVRRADGTVAVPPRKGEVVRLISLKSEALVTRAGWTAETLGRKAHGKCCALVCALVARFVQRVYLGREDALIIEPVSQRAARP